MNKGVWLSLLTALALAVQIDVVPQPEIRTTTGTLTATQVRNLNATPVQVLAAPGVGKGIVIESAEFKLDWNATVYDSVGATEDLYLKGSGGVIILRCDSTNCLEAGATADRYSHAHGDNLAQYGYPLSNSAVEVSILTGEWATTDDDTDGDSPVDYLIRYRISTLD